MSGINSAPKLPKTTLERDTQKRVIVVLDKAPLEITKIGKSPNYQLLASDEHQSFLKKNKQDAMDYRPDIVHQCLLTLLDSPLNRSGHLQVYIRTQRNQLIEVNPKCRIPRTYSRFAGLMVQLLHKLSVKAMSASGGDGGEKLMNIIKNPITDHLPTHCHRIGLSGDAKQCMTMPQLINELYPEVLKDSSSITETRALPVVFWIGAMSHGKDDFEHVERSISVSHYPLTASVVCSKICNAFEEHWGIL